MIHEPTEAEILELIQQKFETKQPSGANWIIEMCIKEIANMEASIAKLHKLIDLCKNPEVVAGIELFVGKMK